MNKNSNGLFVVFCLLVISTVGSGCNRRPEPTYVPVSEAEIKEFAAPFHQAFLDDHKSYFKACSDHRRMAWRAMHGKVEGSQLDEFTTGLREEFYMPDYFSRSEAWGFVGMFMLGPVEKSGEWVLRLRMTDKSWGMTYMDLLVEKRTDDVDTRLVITDMYLFNIGRWFSAAMAENMDESGIDVADVEDEAIEKLEQLDELTSLYELGEIESAELLWADLPKELKALKANRLNRLFSIMDYDSTAFETALQDFRKDFPDDPSLMNLEVNWAIMINDWQEALLAVEDMKRILGHEDGYQAFLRGYVLYEMGDYPGSLANARKSIEMEPEINYFRDQLVSALIGMEEYSEAVEQLQMLIDDGYVSTIEYGVASPGFFASEAFLEMKANDPERWESLDDW